MKLIVTAVMALIAVPVAAQTPDAAQPRQEKAADPNKRICKRSADTGSRLAKTVCHSRAEWDEMKRANFIAADDLMRSQPTAR